MAPLIRTRRPLSSSLPTLLSLTKLASSFGPSARNLKRSAAQLSVLAAAEAPIEPEDPPDSPIFWWKLGLSVGLVLLGGVFAGLTLALMGSDDLNLRVLSTSSEDEKERKSATKVLRLLARGRHWVLVVLLLGNVIVNESLPIFLDDVLGGGVAAVIVSTTMIVIFGEIIPQAVCVRYGLAIGGVCAPFVWCLMILFSPIAWPTAKLLDYVLGREEGHTYKKAELKSFLQFHREGDEPLRDDEIGILNGVLSLNEKHVQELMTPIADCLTLSADKILNHEAIDQILLSGFSRIPIHEPNQRDNFIGMLLVKRLITYNPDDEWPVSKLPLLPLPEARPDINCFQALDYFQTGRAHLLLISETPGRRGGAMGIVSLEDLIEEIIGEEIVDETDRFTDNRSKKAAKRSGTQAIMKGIIERQKVVNAFSRRPSRHDTREARAPISLPAPGANGNGTGNSNSNDDGGATAEGLLIQMDNGQIVAEQVTIPDRVEEVLASDGRKLIIGGENGVSAAPPAMSRMNSIAENTVDAVGEYGSTYADAVKKTQEEDGKADDAEEGGLTQDTIKTERQAQELAFPTHRDFEKACKALMTRYEGSSGREEPGPSRTNAGWTWQEHQKAPGHGFLIRRVVKRSLLAATSSSSPSPSGNYAGGDEQRCQEQDNTGLEDDEGESSISARRLASSADGGGEGGRIEVEQSIVYSRTYHVPMLCLRAWDSNGAPLSLVRLTGSGILHNLPEAAGDRPDSVLLDAHSPFPLLQQTEHPETGDIVWSVHPCQVTDAVGEVLGEEPEGVGKVQTDDEKGLRWLECWMMLSNGVVDLAYP